LDGAFDATFDTSRLIGHTVTATFGSRSSLRQRVEPVVQRWTAVALRRRCW